MPQKHAASSKGLEFNSVTLGGLPILSEEPYPLQCKGNGKIQSCSKVQVMNEP